MGPLPTGIVPTMLFVAVLITVTDPVLTVPVVTYTNAPSGVIERVNGCVSPLMTAATELVAVLITVTDPLAPWFVTYNDFPSGVTAASSGKGKPVTVADTVR